MATLNPGGKKPLVMITPASLNPKPATSSTAVKVLTRSELESLQQNKRETTERLMVLMGKNIKIA